MYLFEYICVVIFFLSLRFSVKNISTCAVKIVEAQFPHFLFLGTTGQVVMLNVIHCNGHYDIYEMLAILHIFLFF